MSTDGFENTFVCVHTHLDLIGYLAANISAVQKEGVHLKGFLVLVWGLGQGNRGLSSLYATSPLQTVLANCRVGVCLFYWFCMEKRKRQHLANGMW